MSNYAENFKNELKELENYSNKSSVLSKNYIREPKDAPTLDFPIAKKMWAHIDPINKAFETYFKEGLLIPGKEEEFLQTILPHLEYMNSKWNKWRDVEEYRGQMRDIYSKLKNLEIL